MMSQQQQLLKQDMPISLTSSMNWLWSTAKVKNILLSFLKLFQSLKEFGMLNEESLSNFLKYAGQDLPELTYRMQQIANEVIDLESKKKLSIDALAQLSDMLSWYHRNIKLNKQILSELDKKINQKRTIR